MKQDQNPETPNICNNCVKPEKKPVDEIAILIKCDAATQKIIEENCINEGISFSEYFLRLHEGRGSRNLKKMVADAKNIAYSKDCVELPEGFGEVNLPEPDAPSRTNTTPEPIEPKKRGRPFKNH